MPQLLFKKSNKLIADHVIKAKSLRQRVQGLIGHSALKEREAFWISACPSIHTFFMKFPIDVIFTDKKFCVQALFENTSSGKILFGGFKSQNVFEMKTGQIQAHNIKKGDVLYVEH